MKPQGAMVDYLKTVPSFVGYQCRGCGAAGVKLWRPRSKIVAPVPLRCAACVCRATQLDPRSIDRDGAMRDPGSRDGVTNRIGDMDPAIPMRAAPDGTPLSYWDYYLLADIPLRWWRDRPTRA